MRCWKRAAKAGHVEGQLLYGLGLYRGIAGLQEDVQDAHMWLQRALKQVGARGEGALLAPAACSLLGTGRAADM
jgi:TPR repeat protein